jgi:CRP/FNR family transcriptional regulator
MGKTSPIGQTGERACKTLGHPCDACEIRHIGVCAELKDPEIERVRRLARIQQYAKGQSIIEQGAPAEFLYNVVRGALRVFRLLADGRRQITGFLRPGDLLGLVFNESYAYGAEALTEVSLCRFPRPEFESLLAEIPTLERRLLVEASSELTQAQDQMLLLGRKTAKERVASFLSAWANRAERRGPPATTIELPMSRSDIADYLGLTTETVSRTFTQLKAARILKLIDPTHVEILQPQTIYQVASGE